MNVERTAEAKCYFCQDGQKVGRYECPFCGEWLTPPELAEQQEPDDFDPDEAAAEANARYDAERECDPYTAIGESPFGLPGGDTSL